MNLPENVAAAMEKLELAGFPAYAVGGCVRDWLLGKPAHDYDLCTAATPAQIRGVFADFRQVLAGEKHGTVGIVFGNEVVEITTFRTEGGYDDARHPGWVAFVSDITEDLSRRDFTVNAMAYSPTRGLCDPFGGREDLKNGIIRAVGIPEQRFSEDALRILRGLRFSARLDFAIDAATFDAMLAKKDSLDCLARERVFEELGKLLLCADAEKLVNFAPILACAIAELSPMVGFHQHSPHHAYDVFTHTAYVVENVPRTLPLRWAALLHDVGKPACFTQDATGRGHFYGHAKVGAELADAILHRLKAPTALRENVVFLIANHMTALSGDKKLLKRYCAKWGMASVRQLLALQRADMGSKGTGESRDDDLFLKIEAALDEIEAESACLSLKDLAVHGEDMMALGLCGSTIGQTLHALLEAVIDERIPNEKAALLDAAKNLMENQNGI